MKKPDDQQTLAALTTTLDAIASGGIHDQIAGGFHRYAIDPGWRVPHFEKMLYDQAQMTSVYVKAYQLTGRAHYGSIARKTLNYILADLTAPHGGFYATRDADSLNSEGEEEEGAYFVWSPEELVAALGEKDALFARNFYGTIADGDFAGKIILNRDQSGDEPMPRLDAVEAKLSKARQPRHQPRRDEKIVLNWNALTISALAQAATIFGDEAYKSAALRSGEFLWHALRKGPGQLKRSYFNASANVDAELEDYALLAKSYLDLYDLTDDVTWLERSRELSLEMEVKFSDPNQGDFYASAANSGFTRPKTRSDSDLPAGNAIALDLLTRLSRRLDEPEFERKAETLLAALSGHIVDNAIGGAASLAAADRFLNGQTGVIQYSEFGRVKTHATLSKSGLELKVTLKIAKGWHVNANKPLEDNFIPTTLSVEGDRESNGFLSDPGNQNPGFQLGSHGTARRHH